MSGNLNLINAKQSSLEEEITEPNESETNNTTFIESENHLMPEGKAVLIADGDGTIDPPPPPPPQPSQVPKFPRHSVIV